jgi:hypothetical protein
MDLKEEKDVKVWSGWNLVQDRDQWRSLNKVMNLRVP